MKLAARGVKVEADIQEDEAFRKAGEWAKSFPGTEYVVLQEKGSRWVDNTSTQKLIYHFMKDLRTGEACEFLDNNDVTVAKAYTVSVSMRDDGKVEVLYLPTT